jgi:hypothetical protein
VIDDVLVGREPLDVEGRLADVDTQRLVEPAEVEKPRRGGGPAVVTEEVRARALPDPQALGVAPKAALEVLDEPLMPLSGLGGSGRGRDWSLTRTRAAAGARSGRRPA